MISLDTSSNDGARIKVIGVGGGGGNAVNNMINRGLTGVDFIAVNTDKQALDHNLAQIKIQAGKECTRGLGAGANPEVGQKSVEESLDQIKEALQGSDMVFVTAGMGGGTGTGGAPIVAKVASDLGALVVGIITTPFSWEGKKRSAIADEGILQLREHIDALIIIPNQKLLEIVDVTTSFSEAFQNVDEVLFNATRGISDIIGVHGYVNVDFADVRTIMEGMGDALMGIGTATGENRAEEATRNALNSPLLEGLSIEGAQGVLVNITGGSNMTMHEVAEALEIIEKTAGGDANIIHGVVQNGEPNDDLVITVVATGFNKHEPASQSRFNGSNVSTNIEFLNDKVYDGNDKTPESHIESATTQPIFPGIAKAPTSSPKGFSQLKRFDRPAYERRSNDTVFQLGELKKQEKNENDEKTGQSVKETINNKEAEQPAFLRRILD